MTRFDVVVVGARCADPRRRRCLRGKALASACLTAHGFHPETQSTQRDWVARVMASAERSTSSSVVVQFAIDTRSTWWPCQVVPPSQQVPSRWMAATAARLASSPPGWASRKEILQ
jgi:hypothetical protein